MRKFVCVLATAIMVVVWVGDAHAQINRRQIKKNNRRMMTYRGKKYGFGKEKRYNSIGLMLSALNYYGDLAPKPSRFSTDIGFTRPSIGLSFSHRFGPRYSLTGQFLYGTLKGSDAESSDANDAESGSYRHIRNLSFRNRIMELSVIASFDLFENQATYISRVSWTPYFYIGAGVIHHNPQAQVPATDLFGNTFDNAGKWVDLQPLGTEGQYLDTPGGFSNSGIKPYKLIQPVIPIGIGARFRLNEVIDLSVEMGFRYLFTDYIDDVSGNYVYVGAFGDDELAKAMSYRSNEVATPNLLNYRDDRYADTRTYDLVVGYGHENDDGVPPNKRGDKDKDVYTVVSFRLSYIFGKSFHRAKFR